MNSKSEILNELIEISPLIASLNKTNVYSAPDNYFNNLSDSIVGKIDSFQNSPTEELSTIAHKLKNVEKISLYTVPDNYFNNLSGSILRKIQSSENSNELSEIAPLLSKIGKENVYTVPENYFESFKVSKHIAKIIPLRRINTFTKYAVAAVMVGIIFTGIFLYSNHLNKANSTVNIASAMKNVSDDELDKYADEYGIQLNDDSIMEDDSELNIAAELKTVSNEELQQYYNTEHLHLASQEN